MEALRKSYDNSLIIRRAMEKLDNNKLDLLIKALDNGIASKLFSDGTELDILKLVSKILKPFFTED